MQEKDNARAELTPTLIPGSTVPIPAQAVGQFELLHPEEISSRIERQDLAAAAALKRKQITFYVCIGAVACMLLGCGVESILGPDQDTKTWARAFLSKMVDSIIVFLLGRCSK